MDVRAELTRFTRATNQAARLAVRDLERFWNGLDTTDVAACREALADFVPQLVGVYGQVAAQAAVEWYARLRDESHARGEYTPTPAPATPAEAIQTRIRSALAPLQDGDSPAALAGLGESVETWVKNAKRDTITHNVGRDPARPRFARVPRGATTCDFCLMLAGRGWVYHTRTTAGEMNRFHAHCDCEIVPSWDAGARISGYDPEALRTRYERGELDSGVPKSDGRKRIDAERASAAGGGAQPPKRPRAVAGGPDPVPHRPVRVGAKPVGDGTVKLETWDTYVNKLIDRYNRTPEIAAVGGKIPPVDPPTVGRGWPKRLPRFDDKAFAHALYGDRRGAGGHLSGYGWINGRPEFPADWGPDDVRAAARTVLADWDGSTRGRISGDYKGIRVEVYVRYREKSGYRVASVYPHMGPGGTIGA